MLAVRTLECGETTVSVRPDRGALVTGLNVAGTELLYLDAATLDSPTGAVRGGIPLLFPFAGELAGGRLAETGTSLPRHGFARRKPWQVTSIAPDRLEMQLPLDSDITEQFPFDFDTRYVVSALPRGVRVELIVDNRGAASIPLAPGWHPYFPCAPDLKRACLGQLLPARDLQSTPVACDVNIPAPPDRRVDFDLPGVGAVSIAFSEQLRTLEVWTPAEQPLVCVEPWVGPSNTINTPDRVTLSPGAQAVFWMEIRKTT